MNQVFAGGIALIIAFILWSSKKQSKGSFFFKPQNNSFKNKIYTNGKRSTKSFKIAD